MKFDNVMLGLVFSGPVVLLFGGGAWWAFRRLRAKRYASDGAKVALGLVLASGGFIALVATICGGVVAVEGIRFQ